MARTPQRAKIVRINKDHRFYPMSQNGNIVEARLIMAELHDRLLRPGEVVYHIDHDRGNNDISNLRLLSKEQYSTVSWLYRLQRQRKGLDDLIRIYRKEAEDLCIDLEDLGL